MKRICVFAGSSAGSQDEYRAVAQDLGRILARRGTGVVFGGGSIGLMAAVADAALAERGHVIGVIPGALVLREVAHHTVSELHIVRSMHERKAMMADLSDGFIALPGGWGTLEELFEVLTWSQLGLHKKPCGLLNVRGYYDQLLGFVNHAVGQGFLKPEYRAMISVADSPAALLDLMAAYRAPEVPQWIDEAST